MSTPEPGLRELKKRMTRQSIADAALQLTLTKGLDHVTIEEIAHVAFVSPRTVSNYFAAKEEAVVAAGTADWGAAIEPFAGAPAAERPLELLCELLIDFVRARTPEELQLNVQTIDLVEKYPTLRPFHTAEYDKLEENLRARVAARTGIDIDSDVYPWLVAATAVSALRSALRLWARSGAPEDGLPDLIRQAFTELREGLPAPRPQ